MAWNVCDSYCNKCKYYLGWEWWLIIQALATVAQGVLIVANTTDVMRGEHGTYTGKSRSMPLQRRYCLTMRNGRENGVLSMAMYKLKIKKG